MSYYVLTNDYAHFIAGEDKWAKALLWFSQQVW
jgi:hypothetical protein